MYRLNNIIPYNTNKIGVFKKYNDNSVDYDNLISFIKILPNIQQFYNFNKYNLVNPNNTTLFNDPNYKEYYINNYKKRIYNNIPIFGISDYDSFYPQTFFSFWEIMCNLDKQHLINHDKIMKFGFIDSNNSNQLEQYNSVSLGHIEATIKYCEYHTLYENNMYIRIPLQKMIKYQSDNKFLEIYSNQQTHEFIKDTYNINIVKKIYNYYKNKKFNFVIATSDDIFQNLISLLICEIGGTCILYIKNYLIKDIDNYIDYIRTYFKHIKLYQPIHNHPLNPECYIILSNFIGCNDNDAYSIINNIHNRYVHNELSCDSIHLFEKIRLNYLYSYRKQLIKFMKTINYTTSNDNLTNLTNLTNINNITSTIKSSDQYYNDVHIKYGLKWCKQFDMKPKSYYDTTIIDNFNHVYLKYTFPQFKLINNNSKNIHSFRNTKMHELKRKLNNYKRIIDTKEQFVNNNIDDDIIDWNKLTDCVDVYRHLKNILKWKYNSEMTTNAFLKMYEILCKENIINKNLDKFKVFHICEAPGAFIASTHQYIKSNTNINNYIWYAQSLNPHSNINRNKYPSLLDDCYKLIKFYKNRWLFGIHNTGDITCEDTINSYMQENVLSDIDLITGDGGLKVPPNKFNEQEAYVAHVIYGEIVTVLKVLPQGKDCIIKAFIPFAETISISTIYLLTTVFSEVNIVKPLTSHPGSSEVYIICKNYTGYDCIPQQIKNTISYILNNFNINCSIFPQKYIPDDFIDKLYECSDKFVSAQIAYICRSLYYRYKYYNDYDNQQNLSYCREYMINKWLDICNIKPLMNNDTLLKRKIKY